MKNGTDLGIVSPCLFIVSGFHGKIAGLVGWVRSRHPFISGGNDEE